MSRPILTALSPSRRQFLAALGGTALPSLAPPGFVREAGARPKPGRILVLVELAGGNDGLNTVIPIRDDAYRGLRPEIGIERRAGLGLDADTALHPSMRGFAALWEAGDLRIVEGVGYPEPNRSHFRSIEIWNTGGGPNAQTTDGWVATSLAGVKRPAATDAQGLAQGLVLGGEMGPLAGPGRFSALRDLDAFVEADAVLGAGGAHPVRPQGARSPLAHVLSVYDSAGATREAIRKKLGRARTREWDYPESDLAEQLSAAGRLLEAGVETAVLKVVQEGYDTHEGQPERHADLLDDLSRSVAAFARHMRAIGLWDRIALVTYSEFGRRARENGSAGTDHGAAAPVLAAGGAVAGGFDGGRPALDRLVEDDLAHTTDYRALYAAILADLWGLRDTPFAKQGFTGVRLLG